MQQQRYVAPPSPLPAARQRKWPLLLGIGCAVVVAVAIATSVVIVLIGQRLITVVQRMASDVTTPGVAPPPGYVGSWSSTDGQTLIIGRHGRATFTRRTTTNNGTTSFSIDRGLLDINTTTKTLTVRMGGVVKVHVDSPPHKAHGTTVMTLSGTEFRRTGDPPASLNAATPFDGAGS